MNHMQTRVVLANDDNNASFLLILLIQEKNKNKYRNGCSLNRVGEPMP